MSGIFASLVAVALIGCASATPSLDDAVRPSAGLAHDVVGVEELRRFAQGGSLYEALSRIRPTMLRTRTSFRPGMRSGGIDVFINGSYAGGAEVLLQLLPGSVAQVRLVQRAQGFVTYGNLLRGEHALFITLLR